MSFFQVRLLPSSEVMLVGYFKLTTIIVRREFKKKKSFFQIRLLHISEVRLVGYLKLTAIIARHAFLKGCRSFFQV